MFFSAISLVIAIFFYFFTPKKRFSTVEKFPTFVSRPHNAVAQRHLEFSLIPGAFCCLLVPSCSGHCPCASHSCSPSAYVPLPCPTSDLHLSVSPNLVLVPRDGRYPSLIIMFSFAADSNNEGLGIVGVVLGESLG